MEKQFESYKAWRKAVKEHFKDLKITWDGDKDICFALEYGVGTGLGEWEGSYGVIYGLMEEEGR